MSTIYPYNFLYVQKAEKTITEQENKLIKPSISWKILNDVKDVVERTKTTVLDPFKVLIAHAAQPSEIDVKHYKLPLLISRIDALIKLHESKLQLQDKLNDAEAKLKNVEEKLAMNDSLEVLDGSETGSGDVTDAMHMEESVEEDEPLTRKVVEIPQWTLKDAQLYQAGDEVKFNGRIYKCLVTHNQHHDSFTPEQATQWWTLIYAQ